MTPEPSDLVRQMRILVEEEAFLWEVPQAMTDYHGSGQRITHGPWNPNDCVQILVRWFERNLLDCIATSWATLVRSDEVVRYEYDAAWRARATEVGQHLVLAREDAGALLRDPSTWRKAGVGAGVMLCRTDASDGMSFEEWCDALSGLPESLIHAQG